MIQESHQRRKDLPGRADLAELITARIADDAIRIVKQFQWCRDHQVRLRADQAEARIAQIRKLTEGSCSAMVFKEEATASPAGPIRPSATIT